MAPGLTRFSNEEDEMLIEFVAAHTNLWDMKHREFKDAAKRRATWKEIAKKVNKTRPECQKRWKSIRDHYKRQRKEKVGVGVKRAIYWDKLKFLDGSDGEKVPPENASESPPVEVLPVEVDDDSNSSVKDDSSATVESETPFPRNSSVKDGSSATVESGTPFPRNSSVKEGSSATVESGTRILRNSSVKDVSSATVESGTPFPQPGSSRPTTVLNHHPPAKKRNGHPSILLQYLQEKRGEDGVPFRNGLEQHATPVPEENDVDMFFKTMALTVKKFRPDLVIQAKMKVFQTVTEMEVLNQESGFASGFSDLGSDESLSNEY